MDGVTFQLVVRRLFFQHSGGLFMQLGTFRSVVGEPFIQFSGGSFNADGWSFHPMFWETLHPIVLVNVTLRLEVGRTLVGNPAGIWRTLYPVGG